MEQQTENPSQLRAKFSAAVAMRALDRKLEEVRTQNKMAALRSLFDRLDELRKEGMRIEQIIECLAEAGLDITATTYRTMMARIRRERGLVKRRAAPRKAPAQPAPARPAIAPPPPAIPAAEIEHGFGQSKIRSASPAPAPAAGQEVPAGTSQAPAPRPPVSTGGLSLRQRALERANERMPDIDFPASPD